MSKQKKLINFTFHFDTELELWYWLKQVNNEKEQSHEMFQDRQDAINDAIINGYINK